MTVSAKESDRLLRRVLLAVARLPADDLPLVADFVESLTTRGDSTTRLPAEILADARQRAEQLKDLPRAKLMEQFARAVRAARDESAAAGFTFTPPDDE